MKNEIFFSFDNEKTRIKNLWIWQAQEIIISKFSFLGGDHITNINVFSPSQMLEGSYKRPETWLLSQQQLDVVGWEKVFTYKNHDSAEQLFVY